MANEQEQQPRPKMTGSVTTPIVPRQPNGPEWEALNAATTLEDLAAVEERARSLGYGEDGNLMTRIRQRVAEMEGLSDG